MGTTSKQVQIEVRRMFREHYEQEYDSIVPEHCEKLINRIQILISKTYPK